MQNELMAHRSRMGTQRVLAQIAKIMEQYDITLQDIEQYSPVKVGHNEYIRKEANHGWRSKAKASRNDNETASGQSASAVRKYRREVSDEHGAASEASRAESSRTE